MKALPTLEEVREHLSYDPATGVFTWVKPRCSRMHPGALAGSRKPEGYVRIYFGRMILAHRLAWFYVHGEWPTGEIDHINGNRADNRIANLRVATHAENGRNRGANRTNSLGLKGVSWHPQAKMWRARIHVDRKQHCLGYFLKPEDAHAAYCAAADKLHGAFAKPGNALVASKSSIQSSRRHPHA